jgi:hypothetical protein
MHPLTLRPERVFLFEKKACLSVSAVKKMYRLNTSMTTVHIIDVMDVYSNVIS